MLSTLSSAKKAALLNPSKHLQHLKSFITNSHIHVHKMMTATTTNLITTGLLALLAALTLYLLQKQNLRPSRHPKHPFPFLALPPELRLKIYTCFPPGETGNTKIYLINKQINAEYIHHHATTTRIQLSVSAKNYTHPSKPTSSPSSSSTTPPPTQALPPLWTLSPTLTQHLQKATIHLTLTSPLLGYSSPRDIVIPSPSPSSPSSFDPATQFPLTQHLTTTLCSSAFPSLKDIHVKIRAIPDPLWNPIWFWYHVSQALKSVARIRKISFEVEGWSPGQHGMERRRRTKKPLKDLPPQKKEEEEDEEEEKWTWVCERGHWMADDGPNGGGCGNVKGGGNAGEGVMAAIGGRARKGEWEFSVREFCMRILYDECGECVGPVE
ncbi:unnamed protein product [Periconia digitata]|uniref:Uncharacterized protein n=1 Tax=Periconia digitata TaxID=1303443 RepID=A0A9W4UGZ6_9PLEO|nr:unnamed protein product [Periconia digitata]